MEIIDKILLSEALLFFSAMVVCACTDNVWTVQQSGINIFAKKAMWCTATSMLLTLLYRIWI